MLFSRHLFPLALALALASTAAGQSLETLRAEADRTAALALKAAETAAEARQNLTNIKAEYNAAKERNEKCNEKLETAKDNAIRTNYYINHMNSILRNYKWNLENMKKSEQSNPGSYTVQIQRLEAAVAQIENLVKVKTTELQQYLDEYNKLLPICTAEATTTATEPTTTSTEPTTTSTEPTTTSTEPATTTQTTIATDPTDSTTTAQTAVVTDPSYTLGHIFAQLRQIVFGLLSNFLQWISAVVKFMEVLAEKAFDNLNTSTNAAL